MTTGKRKLAGLAALLLLNTGALSGVAAAKEWLAIQTEEIAGALVASGMGVTADQVEPLCTVRATHANPRLTVVNVAPLEEGVIRARLQCESTDVCLPFYVVVHGQKSGQVKTASIATPSQVKPEDMLVRSGRAATLVFEGQNMRMTLPVVCLQSGARGQRVRVMSKDRKKIYLARVTGEGIVSTALGD